MTTGVVYAGPDIQAAANDVCKCLEEPNKVAARVIKKLKQAQASGNSKQMMTYQGEMMGVMTVATKCFEQLPAKYPEIDKSKPLQDKVMALTEKQCPNPAAQMGMH